MLVLSRKAGEKIAIGDNIVIVVVDCGNGRVRIGIDAPRDVSVRRTEIVDRSRQSFQTSPAATAELATAMG